MRLLPILLLPVLLSGCAVLQRRAASIENEERRRFLVRAEAPNPELHVEFHRAHALETASISEAERREGVSLRLHGLLYAGGDHHFAAALRREPPAVIRSVARLMRLQPLASLYPETYALLRQYRRDVKKRSLWSLR